MNSVTRCSVTSTQRTWTAEPAKVFLDLRIEAGIYAARAKPHREELSALATPARAEAERLSEDSSYPEGRSDRLYDALETI